jgi:hypothetical protein
MGGRCSFAIVGSFELGFLTYLRGLISGVLIVGRLIVGFLITGLLITGLLIIGL